MANKQDILNLIHSDIGTRGYLESPVFQKGFEEWETNAPIRQGLHRLMNPFLSLAGKAKYGLGYEGLGSASPWNTIYANKWAPKASTYGHEISHLGWEYDNKLKDLWASTLGSEWTEEIWNKMHDVKYVPESYWAQQGKKDLLNQGHIERMFGPLRYMSPYHYTPKGIETIKRSGLIPEHQRALGHYIPERNAAEDQRIREIQESQYVAPERTFNRNLHIDRVAPTYSRETFDAPPSRYHQGLNAGGIVSLVV